MRIVPWALAASSAGEPVLPVAVISLPDQAERRQLLIERGLPASWLEPYWPATDLRKAKADELSDFVDVQAYPQFSGEPLRAAVVGCATSHRCLAKWLTTSAFPLLLILEDDVVLCTDDPGSSVMDVAEHLWQEAERGESFVCHLGARPEQLEQSLRRPLNSSIPLLEDRRLWWHIDPRPTIWRAHAYLLSRSAAQQTVAREPQMRTVADDWIQRRDLGFLNRLYLAEPRIFRQDETITSTLGIPPKRLDRTSPRGLFQRGAASLRFRSRMVAAQILHQRPFRLASPLR
jgi:hypothetical protein